MKSFRRGLVGLLVAASVVFMPTASADPDAVAAAKERLDRIHEESANLDAQLIEAITRAEDKTMELQARAGAMDELIASGAIEDPTRSYGDDITRELDSLANDHAIDAELSALKAQLGTGRDGSAPELESGAENGTDPHTGSRSVPDTEMGHLNRIDARVEHAIGTTSQNELTEALTELVTTVRTVGTPIADDNIIDSDLIVPDVSATIEEVSVWLSENPAGDGLIPG